MHAPVTLRAQALDSVCDIANDLVAMDPRALASDPSLGRGGAGIALFLVGASHALDEPRWGTFGLEVLTLSMDALEVMPLPLTLFDGVAGIAWTAQHLADTTRVMLPPVLEEIDDALLAYLTQPHAAAALDLVAGLAGLSVYFSARPHAIRVRAASHLVSALINSAADGARGVRWLTPDAQLPEERRTADGGGIFDLGMAHGSAGIAACLALLADAQSLRGPLGTFLVKACAGLKSAQTVTEGRPAFPHWHDRRGTPFGLPSRLGWCYGDASVAFALGQLGLLLHDAGALNLARTMLLQSSTEEGALRGVHDACLCHGSAGLALLTHRLAQAASDHRLAERATAWLRATLALCRSGTGIGGFRFALSSSMPREVARRASVGLLEGAAGVGLALLALSGFDVPSRTTCLLPTNLSLR